MIFLLFLALFIPMFGAPDPHNLTRFAGLILILATIEFIIELFLLNILISKPGGVTRIELKSDERLAVKRNISRKQNAKK